MKKKRKTPTPKTGRGVRGDPSHLTERIMIRATPEQKERWTALADALTKKMRRDTGSDTITISLSDWVRIAAEAAGGKTARP